MKRRPWKQIVGIALAAAALATAAAAYWTATGVGSGSTLVPAGQQPVVLSPATPSTSLYPGGSAEVAVTVTNPNAFRVRLSSLQLDTSQGTGGFAADAGHSGCNVSSLSFTTASVGQFVPARVGTQDGTLTLSLPNAVSMSSTAASACQDATFTLYLAAA
jgi:hypothetical protein